MNKNIHTFLGCDANYEESQMVLFGAPYDGTTSYRPGTRFASAAIRNESYGIETFSPYQEKDLTDYQIFDGGDLELPFGDPVKPLGLIEEFTAEVLNDGKFPLMIGGEHLVTLGAMRAVVKQYPDVHIIHFDAHADLREDYLGVKLSHATVIRRCHELVGDHKIYQFGIRSGEREEFLFGKEHVTTCRFDFHTLDAVVDELARKQVPVYLTLDLDVLDPSVFPGTGTPEAGGVSFSGLFDALQKVSRLQVVAADMNELSPVYDQSGASTALACKLLREMMLMLVK